MFGFDQGEIAGDRRGEVGVVVWWRDGERRRQKAELVLRGPSDESWFWPYVDGGGSCRLDRWDDV